MTTPGLVCRLLSERTRYERNDLIVYGSGR